MGIFDKLKGELVDIVEWQDSSNQTLVYRFERYQNEIKNGAQLVVREGQVAVFINQGQLADVFAPGRHVLKTENLPLLSTLMGWKHGFNSPFKAEVYFVNTRNFTDQKWGTKNPIILNDDRFGMLEVRAFGNFAYKVSDGAKFIKEIVGTDGHFTQEEIAEHLKSLIVTRFTDTVGESQLPVESFAANLSELSSKICDLMAQDFTPYGLQITKFLIENVSMPEEIKKEIFELSRLNRVDLNKLAQLKAAKSMEAAASNPNGMAGGGMGMGMGYVMAQQMAQTMNPGFGQPAPQQAPQASAPPPLPSAPKYFVAVGGQQSGPFDLMVLKGMIAQNQVTPETLVWKEGMPQWIAAQTVEDFKTLFGGPKPPPLPGT